MGWFGLELSLIRLVGWGRVRLDGYLLLGQAGVRGGRVGRNKVGRGQVGLGWVWDERGTVGLGFDEFHWLALSEWG